MIGIKNVIAIICGGGPAPGINSVISAVTIEADRHGWDVLGIYDGFSRLASRAARRSMCVSTWSA